MSLLLRLLLRLLPVSFRARHGGQMRRFWELQRREPRYEGRLGELRFRLDVARDVVATAWRQRAAGPGRRGAPSPATVPRDRPARDAGNPRPPFTAPASGSPATPLSGLGHDLRSAGRALRRSPSFTLVAVTTLALGIGATTAIFSVFHGILLEPLPYPDPERLVAVWRTRPGNPQRSFSYSDFVDWREATADFAGVGAYYDGSVVLRTADQVGEEHVAWVTAGLLPTLGVAPAHGRLFREEEDRRGAPATVILGDRVWRRRFGGDPGVVDELVDVDGTPTRVVGIMPPGFAFPDGRTGMWLPTHEDALLVDSGIDDGGRSLSYLDVIGRLAAGVDRQQAQIRIQELVAAIDAEHRSDPERLGVRLEPLRAAVVGDVGTTLEPMLGAVGLVLLIACINVANLSLARAVSRRRELAVRAALGAGGARIVRQPLVESLFLGLAGGLGGAGLAYLLVDVIVGLAPAEVPRIEGVAVDGPVLLFTLAASVLTGIAAGLAPAWRAAAGGRLGGARGQQESRRGLRLQSALAVAQVGLAVVVVVAAALLLNSFVRLASVDPGFDAAPVLTAQVMPSDSHGGDERVTAFFRALRERVEAVPGVASAAVTYSLPYGGQAFLQQLAPVGGDAPPDDEPPWVGTVIVSPGYFETLGVPLLQGRDFSDADGPGAAPVVIVNETLAAMFWPGEDPVGQRLEFLGGVRGTMDSLDDRYFAHQEYTVVGVAASERRSDLQALPPPEIFRPHAQWPWASLFVAVRAAAGDPAELAGPLRRIVEELDAGAGLQAVEPLARLVSDSLVAPRFHAVLAGAFAAVALLVAAVGIYGVLAFRVSRRVREIGIRMALGADAASVVRGVVRSAGAITMAGLGLGLAGALATARLVEALLFGISATDPLTYLVVVAVLAATALAASWIPARRAARTDPMVALRAD